MWAVLGVFLLPRCGVPWDMSGEETGSHRLLVSFKHRPSVSLTLALYILTTCRIYENDKLNTFVVVTFWPASRWCEQAGL